MDIFAIFSWVFVLVHLDRHNQQVEILGLHLRKIVIAGFHVLVQNLLKLVVVLFLQLNARALDVRTQLLGWTVVRTDRDRAIVSV